MPTLTIDDKQIEVAAGLTVIQACELAGVEIPRFCYHDRLQIAGNCRMCLVEMEKAPKPIASCAMPVSEGMVIKTNTPPVKKAREGVMEFLLINHPLDCPICDQGGECDLQDQAFSYGGGQSRFEENKRAVDEKYMGPLIKTTMTRCIHCTRCVRFAEEIAGVPDIGAIYRGEKMEITTLEQAVASELSANVIDLCPVGALTSKPYAFNARPWELTKTESIDVLDALCANIRIDTRGAEVLRILPRLHEDINEEWLSDKSRYACDGLKRQRLDKPFVRVNGTLQPASWDEAFAAIAAKMATVKPAEIAAIAGDLADVEAMYSLRLLLDSLGVASRDCRQDGAVLDANDRASYIFNTSIAGIEQADLLLLIGTNPRVEAPLLNARIRKRYLTGKLKIAVVGEEFDLTYPYEYLGKTAGALEKVLSARSAFAKQLKEAQNPMLILGMGALTREDSKGIVATAVKIAEKFGFIKDGWNGYNVLQTAAGRVGGLDVKFVPTQGGLSTAEIVSSAHNKKTKVVYLLGADEIDNEKLKNAFVIYQGHHGDKGASVADVILPAAAYTEKNACYVNLEGRVQYTQNATLPVGDAREDWKIIRALSAVLGKTLPFDNINALRGQLAAENPVFATQDEIIAAPWKPNAGSSTALLETPFAYPIKNFYQTDPISRASKTMAECAKVFVYGKSKGVA
jgi:NADH-quinone oxidoreductase subunit G